MQTIAEFIEKAGVTLESTPVPENPNMADMVKGSMHFHCVLRKGDKHLTTYYSVGPGIVEHWIDENRRTKWPPRPRPWPVKRNCLMVEEYYAAHRDKYRPDLPSLLDCLASDASGVENARNFEEWAADYGYDSDSIKAEKTYRACRENARALESMLGRADFETLLYDTERE